MNKKKLKKFIVPVTLILGFVVFTILVLLVDKKAIGPQESVVGFAIINKWFADLIGSNMMLYKVADYLGYVAIGIAVFFFCVAVWQLFTRKSFKKVDWQIYALAGFYVMFALIYVMFEVVVVNTRPVLIEGVLEASYPSTHTLMALCLCISAIFMFNYLIRQNWLKKVLDVFCIVLCGAILICRILSGVHWLTDIIASIILAVGLLWLLFAVLSILNKKEGNETKKEEEIVKQK